MRFDFDEHETLSGYDVYLQDVPVRPVHRLLVGARGLLCVAFGAPLYFETFPVPSSSAHIYRLKVVPNKVGVWPPFGLGADLVGSNLYPRVQRKLLPHHENLLLLPPPTRIHLLKVELPEQVGQDKSHFQVCEIAAEAVSRPD